MTIHTCANITMLLSVRVVDGVEEIRAFGLVKVNNTSCKLCVLFYQLFKGLLETKLEIRFYCQKNMQAMMFLPR